MDEDLNQRYSVNTAMQITKILKHFNIIKLSEMANTTLKLMSGNFFKSKEIPMAKAKKPAKKKMKKKC